MRTGKRKKSIKQAPRKKTLAKAAAAPIKRLDVDTTPVVAIPLEHNGAWVVRCAPGLGRTAIAEMVFRRVLGPKENASILRQRNHDLIFIQQASHDAAWDLLRIPEEIHACVIFGRYKVSATQLDKLSAVLRDVGRSFRVIVSADGAHFPRHETGRWLQQEIGVRQVLTKPKSPFAVHAFCIEERYYICLLHSEAAGAEYRTERTAERPGSLPPTIAAGMAFLGKPGPGMTILDPVCGSGTLLAEAYAYAPEATFIGIDNDRGALVAARQNLSHLPDVRLSFGDGSSTGLPAGSITLFLANLPFGKQHGEKSDNPQLYRDIITEIQRLGKPGEWRASLLSSDKEPLEAALAAAGLLFSARKIPVAIRGEWAVLYVVGAHDSGA